MTENIHSFIDEFICEKDFDLFYHKIMSEHPILQHVGKTKCNIVLKKGASYVAVNK